MPATPRRKKSARRRPAARLTAETNPLRPELLTADGAAAAAFYRGLFGWQFQPIDLPAGERYWAVLPGAGPNTGILQTAAAAAAAPAWALFINVPNLRRAVAKAEKLGAKVLRPRTPVAGFGAYATLKDPTGATFHLWQKQTGRHVRREQASSRCR